MDVDENQKLSGQILIIEELLDNKLNGLINYNKNLQKYNYYKDVNNIENQINQSNEDVVELLDKFVNLLEQLSINTTQPSQQLNYDRHQSIYSNYNSEFNRISSSLTNSLNSANLLSSVRNDINAYKQSHQSDTDLLLAERGKLDNSHSVLDNSLSQAFETRADFSHQGASLKNISIRLKSTLHTIPGVNSLLNLISARRKRDSIIMGLVIGICIIIILHYIS